MTDQPLMAHYSSSSLALYWAQGTLYYHLFDKPKAAIEAKHQKKFPLTPSMFKLIGTVLFNQICLYWPLCYGLTKERSMSFLCSTKVSTSTQVN